MLICLDGIDGAGKTTQVKLLQRFFLSRGYNVVVLKPFHFIRPSVKKLNSKIQILTSVLKQAGICSNKRSVYQGMTGKTKITSFITIPTLFIMLVIYLGVEMILRKAIHGTNTIIIYDRFYFDKLVPRSRTQYKLYYLVLKQIISGLCIILDVPTQVAYERMKDIRDKYMPKSYYEILRKWYRIYAKLLDLPVINTWHLSPIKTHTMILSIIQEKSPQEGKY